MYSYESYFYDALSEFCTPNCEFAFELDILQILHWIWCSVPLIYTLKLTEIINILFKNEISSW